MEEDVYATLNYNDSGDGGGPEDGSNDDEDGSWRTGLVMCLLVWLMARYKVYYSWNRELKQNNMANREYSNSNSKSNSNSNSNSKLAKLR